MADNNTWRLLKIYLCKVQADIRFGTKKFSARQRGLLHDRLFRDRPVIIRLIKHSLGAAQYSSHDVAELMDGIDEIDFARTDEENIYSYIEYFTEAVLDGIEDADEDDDDDE